jgi:hypothetical protein
MFNVPSFFGFKAGSRDIAADFLARVDAATGVSNYLTITEQTAIITLVDDLNNYGILNKIKAIYPMVGGGNGTLAQNQAACEQNLVSASFTGAFSSGWTFASTGVTPNGMSAFMDTGFAESTNLINTSKHLSFYSKTQDSSKSAHDIGAENVTLGLAFNLYLYFNSVSNKGFLDGLYPSNAAQTNNTNTLGFQIGTRTSTTSQKLYFNNSLLVTNTNVKSVGQTSSNVYIGAANNNGTPIAFSNKECAFASIGDGLTDTEASDFYTAVQAFQTTLSRQV